jgi:hypothetical protein
MSNITVEGGNSVIVSGRSAIVNGKTFPFLDKMKGNSVTIINSKCFIDGYELIDGQWKKTLKAFWHKWT